MEDAPSEENIAAAEAYEALHVPALFQQWGPRVVDAAQLQRGQRILDVACGTGVLAREAALRVGSEGYVAGLDANAGMLAVAERLAPAIQWRSGTAESLPYEDESFDAVISQFGLMFFRDRLAAIREMRRVLVPGGRITIAVWDSLENTEAYPIEVQILERLAGPEAADALRAPFTLGDRLELQSLFRKAEIDSIQITTHHGAARFPSVRAMVEADLRGWLPVMGVELTEEKIRHILSEAEQALSQYVTREGAVEFDTPALIVTGKRS